MHWIYAVAGAANRKPVSPGREFSCPHKYVWSRFASSGPLRVQICAFPQYYLAGWLCWNLRSEWVVWVRLVQCQVNEIFLSVGDP